MENKNYNLQELLKKSPTEITHDEMMFVLENMDMASLFEAAVNKTNKQFIDSVKPEDNQQN